MLDLIFRLTENANGTACNIDCRPKGYQKASLVERGMAGFIGAIAVEAVSKYYAEMNIDGTVHKNELQQNNESYLEQSGITVVIDKEKLKRFEAECDETS